MGRGGKPHPLDGREHGPVRPPGLDIADRGIERSGRYSVGAPAYLDGYAALPLTRSLMDHGMAPGAALAFLVSGGVVSLWGAMAIAPVLRLRPFLLYLALGTGGSIAAGYVNAVLA